MYLIERFFKKEVTSAFQRTLGWLFTFCGVTLAWVFFRSHSFEQASLMFSQLFADGTTSLRFTWQLITAVVLFVLADGIMQGKRFDLFIQHKALVWRWLVYGILLLGIVSLSVGDDQPFIYFQF
jgi:alginate O-acetyltransferase complex protein AlgI